MRRIAFRAIALLTFVVGVVTVWYLKHPAQPPSQFRVHISPKPRTLTPEQVAALPNDDSNIVVSIEEGGKLRLNEPEEVGSVSDPGPLTERLHEIFEERVRYRAFAPEMESRIDLTDRERTARVQVTVRASRSVAYEDVARVVDAAKGGGAHPILLQLDGLPK